MPKYLILNSQPCSEKNPIFENFLTRFNQSVKHFFNDILSAAQGGWDISERRTNPVTKPERYNRKKTCCQTPVRLGGVRSANALQEQAEFDEDFRSRSSAWETKTNTKFSGGAALLDSFINRQAAPSALGCL